jgi:hypothetical protein
VPYGNVTACKSKAEIDQLIYDYGLFVNIALIEAYFDGTDYN